MQGPSQAGPQSQSHAVWTFECVSKLERKDLYPEPLNPRHRLPPPDSKRCSQSSDQVFCDSSAVIFTPLLSWDDTLSCWKREKALDEWRSECWKRSFCRCQTRAMIAVLSLEAIRNVFTRQPNVALCWVIRLRGPCCSPNIYLFIYISSVYFSFSAKKKEKEKELELGSPRQIDLVWVGDAKAFGDV